MVPEHFERILRAFQHRVPFKSFTVELVSGARIRVDHPEAMALRAGVAVYIDPEGTPRFLDHESVSQVFDEANQPA
ncbi:MAG: hypothetical protein JWL69_2279 [Phycisphaerales bacterium]|nr:hypothetical protein [Phycisphaerales bacterium]